MITVKIDYDGTPYLEVVAESHGYDKDPENQLIELFIRKARAKGIVIKNESSFDTANDYATIRLKNKKV